MGIYDISFWARCKSSAVLRYIQNAFKKMPLNRTEENKKIPAPPRLEPPIDKS